jgi:two-component system OmpR family response regulator
LILELGAFMPVTAMSARVGRRGSHVSGSGRIAAIRRAPAESGKAPGPPALTVTVAIPLTGGALSAPAQRLLEAVRELVELGHGSVVTGPEPVRGTPGGPQLCLLTASRQVILNDELLPLTRLEFDLLLFLAENPRRVFSRTQLLGAVWGYEHTGERTVDVHVRRLRVKLGSGIPLITTVYGVGYRLSDEAHVMIKPHE